MVEIVIGGFFFTLFAAIWGVLAFLFVPLDLLESGFIKFAAEHGIFHALAAGLFPVVTICCILLAATKHYSLIPLVLFAGFSVSTYVFSSGIFKGVATLAAAAWLLIGVGYWYLVLYK